MTKPSGLAAFVKKPDSLPADGDLTTFGMTNQAKTPTRKPRGKGGSVALTVRLKRSDWLRLHEVALSQGNSLQGLAEKGLSLVLQELGLPPISGQR